MTNHATITGNLAAPPELRFTQSGKAVLSARVADTPRRFNRDTQQWEDAGETLWVDVTMWDADAEHVAEMIGERKGRVTVTGRLGIRSYETREGEKRQSVTLTADSIYLHPSKDRAPRPSTSAADPWSSGTDDSQAPF